MALAFFLVSKWWKRHITSLLSVINGEVWDAMGVGRCQGPNLAQEISAYRCY